MTGSPREGSQPRQSHTRVCGAGGRRGRGPATPSTHHNQDVVCLLSKGTELAVSLLCKKMTFLSAGSRTPTSPKLQLCLPPRQRLLHPHCGHSRGDENPHSAWPVTSICPGWGWGWCFMEGNTPASASCSGCLLSLPLPLGLAVRLRRQGRARLRVQQPPVCTPPPPTTQASSQGCLRGLPGLRARLNIQMCWPPSRGVQRGPEHFLSLRSSSN